MSECLQTKNQNVLEHGYSVWEYTKKIISGNWDNLRVPKWLYDNNIRNNIHSIEDIKLYTIYHDCGKPFCKTIDNEGKHHFYNHAEISEKTWYEYSDNLIVGKLIGLDMLIHSKKYDEILQLNLDEKTINTLLIVSLAEVHSNAQMFGGIESDSFKIKWKKIDKIGNKFIKEYENHYYTYVIVRNDLEDKYKSVQGTHASIDMYKNNNYIHNSLIYVVVKNEKKLKQVILDLIEQGINFTSFNEPIHNNEFTAICTEPLYGEKRYFMKKFMLLK